MKIAPRADPGDRSKRASPVRPPELFDPLAAIHPYPPIPWAHLEPAVGMEWVWTCSPGKRGTLITYRPACGKSIQPPANLDQNEHFFQGSSRFSKMVVEPRPFWENVKNTFKNGSRFWNFLFGIFFTAQAPYLFPQTMPFLVGAELGPFK